FIATKECVHAHERYKRNILEASETDTVIIKRSIGAPARALKNAWTQQILQIEEKSPTYEALKDYISGEANKRYIYDGLDEEGFAWAGQIVGRIHDIPSVHELFERMIQEAQRMYERLK